MDEVTKKTITVLVEQHEAIVGMKRGKDTIYDVMDRLLDDHINLDDAITGLDTAMEDLDIALVQCENMLRELKEMMKNGTT